MRPASRDEFINPCVIGDYAGIKDGDALLCVNFRADRVREILDRPARSRFYRLHRPPAATARPPAGMTDYSATRSPPS